MTRDPFIISSEERARDWVEVCSNAVQIPKDQAAAVLASLCGFGGWDIMVYAIGTLPPSPVDESLTREQAQARLKNHIEVLVETHRFQPAAAMFILSKIKPTSGEPFAAFTMADNASMDTDDWVTFEDFALDFANSELGQEFVDQGLASSPFRVELEPNRTRLALELCGTTNPMLWAPIFEILGWDFEVNDDDIPDIDESSFIVRDPVLGLVPVYVTPMSYPPAMPDQEVDRASRLQRAACVGDFITQWQDGDNVALLLKRWPHVKVIGDQTFCHLGSAYLPEQRAWKDLLFNLDCRSVGQLLKLNDQVDDIHQGHPPLDDRDGELTFIATAFLSGYDLDVAGSGVLTLASANDVRSNWARQRLIEDD